MKAYMFAVINYYKTEEKCSLNLIVK